jgi:hypothetical protein
VTPPTLEKLIASGVNVLGLENSPIVWGLATAGWESVEQFDEFLYFIAKEDQA